LTWRGHIPIFERVKQDAIVKQAALVFIAAGVLYALCFWLDNHLRQRRGPWQVEFLVNPAGAPVMVVSQPALQITSLQVEFPGETPATNRSVRVSFDRPQPTPFAVPFGQVLFMDLTYLPGTVSFEVFGHEVELLPRTLIVDRKEVSWKSRDVIRLRPEQKPPPRPVLKKKGY
jgi:hypothetical protein